MSAKKKSTPIHRRRVRLTRERGGKCYWFLQGTATASCVAREGRMRQDGKNTKDRCTIDHLYDRFDVRRYEKGHSQKHQVAACHDCNNHRSKLRHKNLPSEIKVKLCKREITSKAVARLLAEAAP